ncbi:MAG TPA: TatD family deoxyribonuclease [Verrucomicrobia bacterium]|nr:MAG: hypothetical protein A2X46_03960 [Lentisphaerae bacterium GWF2_57_35]HBA82497.1 TatD family deoxyribonuclease [Verrucomicrobiota bacterium]
MNLFDAHCHLQDDQLLADRHGLMKRAGDAGVIRMVCCGSAETDWAQVLEIAAEFPVSVVPAVGLHPWYVRERSTGWLDRLSSMLRSTSAVVGEIGLDHALDDRDDAAQEEVFLAQLDLGRQLDRPVCVHCRKAWGRLTELLASFGRLPAGLMIHSYSGAADLIPALVRWNAYFSFSGSITFPNNRRGRQALAVVPEDRLLLETDAPDILPCPDEKTPEPFTPNEPANLPLILRQAALVRNVAEETLAARVWNNSCTFFGVKTT